MSKKPRKIWQLTPPRKASVKVPDTAKKLIQEEGDRFIESTLQSQHIKKNPPDSILGSCKEIYGKWYRSFFHFCAIKQYRCSDDLCPPMEIRFARLEYMGDNQFNLAYFRHTGQWWTIKEGISLEECLREIEINPFLQP